MPASPGPVALAGCRATLSAAVAGRGGRAQPGHGRCAQLDPHDQRPAGGYDFPRSGFEHIHRLFHKKARVIHRPGLPVGPVPDGVPYMVDGHGRFPHLAGRMTEVRFVWQEALTDTAVYLDQSPEDGPVAVGGWSPATTGPVDDGAEHAPRRPAAALSSASDATDAPITTLIIPAGRQVKPCASRGRPFATWPRSRGAAARCGARWPRTRESFVLYELLPGQISLRPPYEGACSLGDELRCLGSRPGALRRRRLRTCFLTGRCFSRR